MRKCYKESLKKEFHRALLHRRVELGLTQEEMAERLMMASRTYIDLDHGKTCCGALTLVLFLIYLCDNPLEFLEELRRAFEDEASKAA